MLLETFLAANCAILSSKMLYTKLEKNQEIENNIMSQGLYHITTPEAADAILETGVIKPSGNIASLGSKKCFFFAGAPDYESFIQNISRIKGYEMVAIKVMPTKEQLSSYKVRSYHDNAVIYKGTCNLEDKQVEKVTLVMDIDEKGKIFTREKTPEEIEKGEYEPSKRLKQALPLHPSVAQQAEQVGKSYLHEWELLWNNMKRLGNAMAFWKKDKLLLEAPKEAQEVKKTNAEIAKERLEKELSREGKLKNIDQKVISTWQEQEETKVREQEEQELE